MSLKDKLAQAGSHSSDIKTQWFRVFGCAENPFPPASQTGQHPHMETGADEKVTRELLQFENDARTRAIVIEGRQGVGKTNFLLHFRDELSAAFSGDATRVIRYDADPEIGFDSVMRKFVLEFGVGGICRIGKALGAMGQVEREKILERLRDAEIKSAFRALAAYSDSESELPKLAQAFIEWLLGQRLLKRHSELIRVTFRLDTMESQAVALRDLIKCSVALGLTKGIYLLLDELEKHTAKPEKQIVVNYLQGLRAFIDALPEHLFLLLSITPEARVRYYLLVPALAGRLSSVVKIEPLSKSAQALDLAEFYVKEARQKAAIDPGLKGKSAGTTPIFEDQEVLAIFEKLMQRADRIGDDNVTQRSFLDALRERTQLKFEQLV